QLASLKTTHTHSPRHARHTSYQLEELSWNPYTSETAPLWPDSRLFSQPGTPHLAPGGHTDLARLSPPRPSTADAPAAWQQDENYTLPDSLPHDEPTGTVVPQ